jgi:hypothetical protein
MQHVPSSISPPADLKQSSTLQAYLEKLDEESKMLKAPTFQYPPGSALQEDPP